MRSLTFALAAVLALSPALARAGDREWEEDYSDQQQSPSDYDVSVDLNVSGAVSFDTFYGSLTPYGDWVVVGSYGRVWRPRVAAGWRPYFFGQWEWTNEGWFWASGEPWGWAAYHYGRWAHDPYYGWIWVPGYEWAPAWVSWRVSGDVIGWAPLAPGLSVYVTNYPFIDFWWTFVPCVRFVSVPVYSVAYAPATARRWYGATAPAPARPSPRSLPGGRGLPPGHAPAWGGPAPRLIEERIGRPVVPARIVPAPAPGARARPGEIPVFRPEGRPAPGWGRGPGPAPAPGRGGGGWPPAPTPGGGRGPGPAPAPGRGGAPERFTPGPGNDGRGPGAVPAPGRGGVPERWAPPPAGNGRGPGAVPAPGRSGAPERWSPSPAGNGRGPGAAPARGRGDTTGDRREGGAPPATSQNQQQGGSPAPARGGEGRGRGRANEGHGPR